MCLLSDLSVLLNNSNIGGKIGGILENHLSYADDMCLISLSYRVMIQLLNMCNNFAIFIRNKLSINNICIWLFCY